MISKTEVDCACCNTKFLKLTTEIKRYPDRKHFCSRDCCFADKATKPIICSHCHNEYIPPVKKKGYNTNFCSKTCQLAHTVRRNDFTGKKLGRCVVKEEDKENVHKEKYWLVQCACKEVFSVRSREILKGNVYECPNCIFRRSQYYIGGKKFGRLSVQDKWEWRTSPTNGMRFRYWLCVCECANELWICGRSILRGLTVSCGCYMQKGVSRYVNETLYPIKHGLSGKKSTKLYTRWHMLVAKCYNSKQQSYHHFGANGYTVCDEWRNNYSSFHKWMESQRFTPDLTIEIKDGAKEFSPSTCYLCPVKTFADRRRREIHLKKHGISYRNETHTLKEWSKILGIGFMRLKRRWDACRDMQQCVEANWKDGSGCHMRREDIDDHEIKRLYEEGMTIVEIEDILGTTAVSGRLMRMGVKMRARKYRSAVQNENRIRDLIGVGASPEQIMKTCGYTSIYYVKRKLQAMGIEATG